MSQVFLHVGSDEYLRIGMSDARSRLVLVDILNRQSRDLRKWTRPAQRLRIERAGKTGYLRLVTAPVGSNGARGCRDDNRVLIGKVTYETSRIASGNDYESVTNSGSSQDIREIFPSEPIQLLTRMREREVVVG